MDYTVENGIIYTEKGLPWPPRWFCDGRVAFQADQESITEIDYFGPKTGGSPIVFLKRFWKGMTFYTICRQRRQVIRAGQCEILPYGFSSRSELCEYGVFTADDRIYLTFRPEYDGAVAVEFYDDFLFFPETRAERDVRYGGAARSWERPRQEGHTVVCSYVEQGVPTSVTFSSDARLVLTRTSRNVKNILTLDGLSAGEEYVLAISFSQKGQRACEGAQAVLNRQQERYQRVSRKAPVLKSGRPLLDQFFQLAPMYHEALKTTDVKGAIRAQSTHYWVWGWDSMTSENAAVYWGDDAFIGQMLDCMEKYSDQEAGIAHAFSRDMRNIDAAAPPAQGMYITLLDLYRLSGGDWQRHYPFARNLYQRIAAAEVRDIGLCRGTSLYPDFRGLIKETGNDISAFNNTVCYCAVRSMERLAAEAGDSGTAEAACALAERMAASFDRLLYNSSLGFVDSSIEADTYRQRGVPSNNAVKWENSYCRELVWQHAEQYLAFYEKHLVSPAGIRPMPEWNECYDADSNQLHCWWPVMSEFYARLINRFDRTDLITQYVEWVEYWSGRLMCPEGIPCYGNEKEVPFDDWNCQCGIWHAYSIRGFYNAVVHCYVGIDFDEKGLNIYPYSGEEVELRQLHFGKRSFDIKVSGSGRAVVNVTLNGENLGSVTTIPFHRLGEENVVEIVRENTNG